MNISVVSSLYTQVNKDSSNNVLKLNQSFSIPRYDYCSGNIEMFGIKELIVKQIIPMMEKFDTFGYTLEIHTDCRSSSEYNFSYSTYIADSLCNCFNRILKPGIDLKCVGLGEFKLANNCYCEYDYLQNIRKFIPDSILKTLIIYKKDSITNEYSGVLFEEIKENNPYVHVVKPCNEAQHQENRRYTIRVRLKEDD